MSVVAAIDIGTNSTRLLVAEVNNEGKVEVLSSGLRTTRLGEGIREKRLLSVAMERTLKAIQEFQQESINYNVDNIILAATSAVRGAINQDEFLSLVKNKTGHSIRVLSGAEEARLSYLGVVSGLTLNPQAVTVMDVGGGSTEFTWNTGEGVVFKSFNIGAVRMTENGDGYDKICEKIAENISLLPRGEVHTLVGVGGTVTTLAAIKLKLNKYDPELVHGSSLSLTEVSGILQLLEQASLEQRKKIVGLQPERADIITAGVSIVHSIMTLLKKDRLVVSEADILHGMALAAAHNVEIKLD